MNAETIIARAVELTERAEQAIEFALKLKSGLLVARSPAFRAGKKVPHEDRHIEIFKPRKAFSPSQVHARKAATADEPQLVYRPTGPRSNYVKSIFAPHAPDKDAAMRNVAGGLTIRKVFTGHLDRRGITSWTHVSAFRHEAIPTETLVKRYRSAGYKVDLGMAKRMHRAARTSGGRAYASDFVRGFVPMVRKPRTASS